MMDESLILMSGSINDLSKLDAENITCCLRIEKCMTLVLKELKSRNSQCISEANVYSLRDHLFCRLPALADKVIFVFQRFLCTTGVTERDQAQLYLSEIRDAYLKVLALETIHADCEGCNNVVQNVKHVFNELEGLLSIQLVTSSVSVHDSASADKVSPPPRCSSGVSDSFDQLVEGGLEESTTYPEFCNSLAISRYSEISHADDWRFYFEDSEIQSSKKNALRSARSRSAEDISEGRPRLRRSDVGTCGTPLLPGSRRHQSNASTLAVNLPPDSPDKFRWDDYDLKQPLVGNNPTTSMSTGKRVGSTGDLTKDDDHTKSSPLKNETSIGQNSFGRDKPPIKLDGLSAEILSATVRRLRLAEQRVSVLEAYNGQLRDENNALVRRLRTSDETVAGLRQQLLSTADNTARQMEDVLSTQLTALKMERDALLETVERLKPLQIQLAGANFEKRLLTEAIEQENKAAAQWRRDRETLEANLFSLQALVQRQRLQLSDAEKREGELIAAIDELKLDKDVTTKRLLTTEATASSALLQADKLSSDLEAASKKIEQLRSSLSMRDTEMTKERARRDTEHASAVDKLRVQLAAELKTKEDQTKQSHNMEIEKLRLDYESQLAKVVEQNKIMETERKTALICMKHVHERELEDIYSNHLQELAALREEMAAKSEFAVSELREEIEAAHSAELTDMQTGWERELREQLAEQRKQLENKFVPQIETQQSDHERILAELVSKYEAKLTAAVEHSRQVELESNKTIERLGNELEAALENQSQMLKSIAEQDGVIVNIRQRLEHQNKELESALIERTNLLSQIEQMRQSLESFTEGQIAAAVANVRCESEIHMEQLSGQLELAKRQLDDTHQLLVIAGQHNSDLRAAMLSQQQVHNIQFEQQRSVWSAEMAVVQQRAALLEEQITDLKAKKTSQEETLTSEITCLKTQIATLLNERQSSRPVVETSDVSCTACDEKSDTMWSELVTENKTLANELARLQEETQHFHSQATEVHQTELDRVTFSFLQQMNEMKMMMKMELAKTEEQLKKKHESEIKALDNEWQQRFDNKYFQDNNNNSEMNGDTKDEYEAKLLLLKQQCDLEKESALMETRQNLLEDHAAVIRQLKMEWENEVKKWQFQLETSRANLHRVTEERSQLETLLKDYVGQKSEMEGKIREYCSTIEEQRLEFTRRLEVEHKDLRTEFENMLQNVSSKLEMEAQLKRTSFFIDFQQRLDAKVAELVAMREQHAATMEKSQARINELQQLADQYMEEKLELEQRFSRERSELRQEIERITASSLDNLRTVVHATEDRLKEAHEAELKSFLQKSEEDHRQEISVMAAKYEGEIQNLSDQLNIKMELQLKELSKQTAAIDSAVTENYRDKLATEVAQIERNLAMEFRQREAEAHAEFDRAHEAEMMQMETLWRKRVEALETQLSMKADECQKMQAEFEEFQATSKRMVELTASDYEQQLKMAVENAERRIKTEADIAFCREKERMQQKIIDERDATEDGLRQELDKIRGQTADLEQSLVSVQRTLTDVIKARDDALEAAKLAANELVVTSGHSLGVFRLLACLVQHVQVLITEKTDQLVARPAMEGEGLIEALAIVRDRSLPSIGSDSDCEDIARPFQEVQMWIVEKFESLLALVDASLIQSEIDHEFAGRAKLAVEARDGLITNHENALKSAEALLQHKAEEIHRKDAEIMNLNTCSLELKDAVERLEVELCETQNRELALMQQRDVEHEMLRQKVENLHDVSAQCDNEDDRIQEVENLWAERAAEMDAAASRKIEECQYQVVSAQQRIDELSLMNERLRIDYEHRLSDSAQHLANKESALKALRKFLDEQTADREAEQEEYQRQIVNLQQTLSERLRALELANNKLALVDDLQKEMEETSRLLQTNQQRVVELQANLADTEDRLRSETGRFQSRLQSTQAEKLRLENDIARARAIISKLESRISGTDRFDCIDNSSSVDRLQQELVETRNRWEAQASRLQTLESELKQLLEDKLENSFKMDDLKTQLEETQKRLMDAENSCSAALSRFQSDIENRERTIAALQAALADRDVQLQTLETTSRQLLNEHDLGNSTLATPHFNRNPSPSFTVNSFGGFTSTHDHLGLTEREREAEELRLLVQELTAERNRQIEAAENARRSLECRLASLENKLASQNEEMESRLHNVANAYERELSAVRNGMRHKERCDDFIGGLAVENESTQFEPEIADAFDGESVTQPGNLSIIAADLNEKFARSDKLDAVLLRRAGIDIDTSASQPHSQPMKMSANDNSTYAGLVTPSTSGSSPSGSGASTSPLVTILHRLEELSSEILRLSDPDTYLLSGAAEGSMMTDRLLAVLHKIAPVKSVAVGTETANMYGALEEMKNQVATLADRWSVPLTSTAVTASDDKLRYSQFIAEISRLLDVAIDQLVSIVVNASPSSDGKHSTTGNVDAVRQLVHVTTQLSSDFSAAERHALTSDCQLLAQRIRELEAELAKDKRSVTDTQKQLDELHEKMRLQSGDLAHLQAKLDNEQQQRLDTAGFCQKLKSQLDESYAEIERARRNSDQMHSSAHELEEMRRSYELVVDQLREKQAEVDKFDSKLTGIKQAFASQLERQQAIASRFAVEVDAYRDKASRSNSELTEAKRSLDIVSRERDRLQTEIDKLLGVMADQERRTQEVTEKMNAAESERCRLSAELNSLREEHMRTEMRVSAKTDASLRQLRESLHRLESENERLRQELSTADQRSSVLSRDLDRAVIASSNAEDRIATLSQQLDSRSIEIGKLSSRLSELEAAGITPAEFERLRQRLTAQDAACERAIEQGATLRARLAELTARLTPIRSQMLLAAARANAIVASVSNSVVLGSIYTDDRSSSNGGAVSVAIASQLESGLRMAANELDQLLSPITSTSSGAAVFAPDTAARLSPPPQFANTGIDEDADECDIASTGHLQAASSNNQPLVSSLLQKNKELGDTIYKMSVEMRQLRRTAANEQVSSASNAREAAASPTPDKTMTVVRQQLRELTAKYVRAEGHRKALVYQKRYLMLVIGDFRDSERQILVKLKAMDTVNADSKSNHGRLFPKSWHSRANANLISSGPSATADPSQKSKLPLVAVFRAAAASIIFVHRSRKLAKRWRKFTGNVATQITENITKAKIDNGGVASSGNLRPAASHRLVKQSTAYISAPSKPNNDLYLMTAAGCSITPSGYDLATASLASSLSGVIDMGFNAADVISGDDTYLTRLEMVRSRLRECRTSSGAAAVSASNQLQVKR